MDWQPSVLYVEDNASNRIVMQILLNDHLQLEQVEIWEDSQDFERRVRDLPFIPDIVLLDIHVQPMDGFQMLAHLRTLAAFRDKPVAAVTASVMNEEIIRLKDAGFNGVISKPIDIDAFPDMLQRLLSGEEIWRDIH